MIFMIYFRTNASNEWEICTDYGYFESAGDCSKVVDALNARIREGNERRADAYYKAHAAYRKEVKTAKNLGFVTNLREPLVPPVEQCEYTIVMIKNSKEL